MTMPPCDRRISDADMRKALARRLAAWTYMATHRVPIRSLRPEARQAINDASDRLAAARRTLVAGLWRRAGRWADPANRVELVLDADGDGYLTLAPGVVRPGVRRLQAADRANARRFGPAVAPGCGADPVPARAGD